MALEIHDDTLLCAGCGGYKDECQHEDQESYFEVDDETVCARLAARQEYETLTKDPEPGVLIKVVQVKRPPA